MRGTRSIILLVILGLLAGCMPGKTLSGSAVEQEEAIQKTAVWLFTQTAAGFTATPEQQLITVIASETPAPTSISVPTDTPIAIPTIERTPTKNLVTLTPQYRCNSVGMGEVFDITIPDYTRVLPGQKFTKTWRIINNGSCTWTRLYRLAFYSGNSMGAMQEQLLGSEVAPGQMADFSVVFTAPEEPGEYQSNWMLMDQDGNYFGAGYNSDAPFWTIIIVDENAPTLTPTITQTPAP